MLHRDETTFGSEIAFPAKFAISHAALSECIEGYAPSSISVVDQDQHSGL